MERIAIRPKSAHPGDSYLFITLSETGTTLTPWVTHIFNDTLAGGKGGHVEGHYFDNLESALEDFNTRR